jgi:hypothetical protein
MPENGNSKYVTQKWLVWVLASLVFAASGIIVADTRSGISNAQTKIDALKDTKVDKEQYCRDISEIKTGINRLVEMHMGQK